VRSNKDLAGSGSSFYALKRQRVVTELLTPAFAGESREATVLEVGSGPGANLRVLRTLGYSRVLGVDASTTMLALSARHPESATIFRAEGSRLPLRSRSVEVVFTVTVLQHNDPDATRAVLAELFRVAARKVILIEDTAPVALRDRRSHWLRPRRWYASEAKAYGFRLCSSRRLHLALGELGVGLVQRRAGAAEGDQLDPANEALARRLLPTAVLLDRALRLPIGIESMVFSRVE
jgi:SAM-dependent methyltransferase